MSIVELIATAFGLACVWLYVRRNIWSWPTGLVQVVLYIWIFFEARLYSDVLLHIVYVGLQLYGWWYWLQGREEKAVPIRRLGTAPWAASLGVAALGIAGLGFVMRRYTNADLPYWDAATTVLSLIAQVLLARKILENWLFWIVVDVLAIGVYAYKGLYITTGLYSVFLVMATMGWFQWIKSCTTVAPASAPDAGLSLASSSPRTADTSS